MANRSISSLTALTAPASGDYLPIVDISEANATDRNKRITVQELLRGAPSGTAAAPGIAFESDNTGIYSPGADQLAFSTGGTGRLFVDASGRVGIGSSSPTGRLNVAGYSSSDQTPDIQITRSSSGTLIQTGPNLTLSDGTTNNTIALQGTQGRFGVWNYGGGSWNERLCVDSSGRLLLGTSTARANLFNATVAAVLQVEGTSVNTLSSLVQNSNDAAPTNLVLGKTRGTTAGSVTVVSPGDGVGRISFQGADGTELVEAARIEAEVDGTPGANDMPGRLVFSTTADGSATPTERMTINSFGRVGIGASSPQAPLHVIGTEGVRVESTTSSDGHIRFINTSGSMSIGMSGAVGNNLLIYDRTNNQSVYNYIGGASGSHAWNVNNTERMCLTSDGRLGIGTSSPTTLLDVNADTIRVRTARTPATSTATGAAGEICWDASYIYVCTAANTWKRAALSTW